MIKEIKQGILFTLVTMVLLGGGYHALLWGIGRVAFPGAGRRQPDSPRRRHDRRLAADRAEVHAAGILPAAAFGCRLQRRLDRRHELRTVESRPSEGRAGTARCHHEAGRRGGRPGAVGDGHGQRRRPRSAHSAGGGGAAGGARRGGAEGARRARARADSRRTPSRRRSGSWAGRASTCSS